MSTQAQRAEFERICRNYSNRMRNDRKRRYAVAYATALLAADLDIDGVQEPAASDLGAMAAQAVRLNINEFVRMANK
jgi:hypothetical protein